jgi:hypothetical protein
MYSIINETFHVNISTRINTGIVCFSALVYFLLQLLLSFWNHLKQRLPSQSWHIRNLNIFHFIWNGLHLIPSYHRHRNQTQKTRHWSTVNVNIAAAAAAVEVVVVIVVVAAAAAAVSAPFIL